jgi:hypothetical protein
MRATGNLGQGVWRALVIACVFGGLCAAGAAAKTVTVGQLFAPNFYCGGPDTWLQTGVASGTSYTVPKAGVITSWSWYDGAASEDDLKLKVARSAGTGTYKIVGEDIAGPQTANAIQTYSAHIPVHAGDLLGISATSGSCGSNTSSAADTYAYVPGDIPPGTTTGTFGLTNFRFPVSAKVALDCVVPNLKGKTLKAAKRALSANSCTVGKVTPKGQTTGKVKSQKPSAGKTLAPGAKVNIRLG